MLSKKREKPNPLAAAGRLTSAFHRYDRDKDNHITKLELRLLCAELGEPLEDPEISSVSSMFERLDGRMTLEMFQQWWQARSASKFQERQTMGQVSSTESKWLTDLFDRFEKKMEADEAAGEKKQLKDVLTKTRERVRTHDSLSTSQPSSPRKTNLALPPIDPELAKVYAAVEARVKAKQAQDKKLQQDEERSRKRREVDQELVGQEGSFSARARLMTEKRLKEERQKMEVEWLVRRQTSSAEAIKVARLLSPEFQSRQAYIPQVKSTRQQKRVTSLLENDRIGHFY
eukprot:GILI01007782.1.p1 GENE.GILI01007782.1~~GILI01007782.1.p1  ORF type:complete len:287 (+),score=70.50 GILI01007782.1:101-961(+)